MSEYEDEEEYEDEYDEDEDEQFGEYIPEYTALWERLLGPGAIAASVIAVILGICALMITYIDIRPVVTTYIAPDVPPEEEWWIAIHHIVHNELKVDVVQMRHVGKHIVGGVAESPIEGIKRG